MSTGDMSQYLDRIDTMTEEVGTFDPDFLAAWTALNTSGGKDGPLSARTKELTCVSIGAVSRRSYSTASHVEKALQHGATSGEMLEAGFVAVNMGGGPALS